MQVILRAAGDQAGEVSAHPAVGCSLVHFFFYRQRLRHLICVPANKGVESLAHADTAISWRDPGNAGLSPGFGNSLVDFLDAQLGTVRFSFQDT